MQQESSEIQCWEMDGTLCSSPAIKQMVEFGKSKEFACKHCIFYVDATNLLQDYKKAEK